MSEFHQRPIFHILHADLDAFYASVEQMDNPEFRGKPVVVGGSPEGRGVVAAASYEARKFGIRSAMPMSRALRLCPNLVRVSARFPRYRELSGQVMDIFHSVTPLVEPLSLDEAYLDITERVEEGEAPEAIARDIKRRVRGEVGLTVSVGASTSKAVSKIASDLLKPDGLVVVAPGDEHGFLDPIPVGMLWGIGPKAQERLAAQSITTIGQLGAQDEAWFVTTFGKRGPELREMALGRGSRRVSSERETKSISAETTLAQDTDDPAQLKELVEKLAVRVEGQVAKKELQGRTVTLKLRTSDFHTFTRSMTLSAAARAQASLAAVAWELLREEIKPDLKFRLVGVGVSNFVDDKQLPLFGD